MILQTNCVISIKKKKKNHDYKQTYIILSILILLKEFFIIHIKNIYINIFLNFGDHFFFL